MRFFALIFVVCTFQSIHGGSVQDAIKNGNERIAQLKINWQREIPEIMNTILPEIDGVAEQFTEVAARIAKEVKNDGVKSKAAESVKIAYDNFIGETKKAAEKMANARPDVLEKAFDGAKLANVGYEKVSKIATELKEAAAGNVCKENVLGKFTELAEKQVNQMTECVLQGGSNFPALPNDIRLLRVTAQKVTKDDILVYQRCPEKPGTICFENLSTHLNKEAELVKRNGDSYADAPHMEVDMQKTVTQSCVKRKMGSLQKQVPEFKNNMDKC